jgi:hypothetical protein
VKKTRLKILALTPEVLEILEPLLIIATESYTGIAFSITPDLEQNLPQQPNTRGESA